MNDYRSHLSVTLWAALVVLALGSLLVLPERPYGTSVLGSAISITLSVDILVALVAVTVVCAGMEAAIRTHPQHQQLRQTYRYWGLPSAIVLAAAAVLPTAQTDVLWMIGLSICALLLGAATVAEYHTLNSGDRYYRNARLLLNVLAYAIAAIVFVLVYQTRSRSLISATLIGITSGLLALDLLRDSTTSLSRILLYSAITAVIMAQFTWILNYWPLSSIRAGLALLVGFYLLVGLCNQALSATITRRQAGEYLALAGLAGAIIIWLPL